MIDFLHLFRCIRHCCGVSAPYGPNSLPCVSHVTRLPFKSLQNRLHNHFPWYHLRDHSDDVPLWTTMASLATILQDHYAHTAHRVFGSTIPRDEDILLCVAEAGASVTREEGVRKG